MLISRCLHKLKIERSSPPSMMVISKFFKLADLQIEVMKKRMTNHVTAKNKLTWLAYKRTKRKKSYQAKWLFSNPTNLNPLTKKTRKLMCNSEIRNNLVRTKAQKIWARKKMKKIIIMNKTKQLWISWTKCFKNTTIWTRKSGFIPPKTKNKLRFLIQLMIMMSMSKSPQTRMSYNQRFNDTVRFSNKNSNKQ